jgi:Icc-related predicted phosphoesterase
VEQITLKLKKELLNLYILENQTITLEGIIFAGTTLWFNDTSKTYKYEKNSQINSSFDVWVYQRNQVARKFLANLNADIIITHYLPSLKSISQQYQNHPRNCFFVCDVEDIIYKIQPLYWLHGHTHSQCNYKIGKTQVIANPYGYPQEASNHNFVKNLCFTLDSSAV